MSSAFPESRVSTGSLQICGTCHSIKGRVPDRCDGVHQLCPCAPSEVHQAQPLWGGDYNDYAELCRCCGLVLLRSGSRWSVWFCAFCKPLVRSLNAAVGSYLIPIGRHSVMAGVSEPAYRLRDPEVATAFVAAVRSVYAGMGGLEAHRQRIITHNLEVIDRADGRDVYLGEYLSRARRSTLTCQDAFAALAVETLRPVKEAS